MHLLYPQPPKGVPQFDLPQDSQSRSRLGSHHVAPTFAPSAVNMGDGTTRTVAQRGDGGRHTGFVVGMGKDTQQIYLQSGCPGFVGSVGGLTFEDRRQ